MRGTWLLAILVGCAYRAGSFASWGHDFDGRRTTVGCIDLSIDRRADHFGAPVLAYDFGNRCDQPVVIDLETTLVVAKTTQGDVPMVPFDPDREIRSLPVDGRSVGAEAIEYRTAVEGANVLAICVDAGSVVGISTPDWQCFDRPRPDPDGAR